MFFEFLSDVGSTPTISTKQNKIKRFYFVLLELVCVSRKNVSNPSQIFLRAIGGQQTFSLWLE